MKDYILVPQERDTYCICSVLQAIFLNHRIHISQGEIADNLNPTENGFFLDDQRIRDFLRSRRFQYDYYRHNATPFNDPDLLLRAMNSHEGFIGINSHVYLLRGYDDPVLELIDPLNNRRLRKDFYETLREMRELTGYFGLVKRLS